MPSSVIRNTHYDVACRTLSIWFVPTGKRYDYAEVPPAIYAAFKSAASKGHFFNTRIRDHFRYREIAEGGPPAPSVRP
ncbi:MAG TPA: KTSC domain-containing protein [Devosiaceae bacterium]